MRFRHLAAPLVTSRRQSSFQSFGYCARRYGPCKLYLRSTTTRLTPSAPPKGLPVAADNSMHVQSKRSSVLPRRLVSITPLQPDDCERRHKLGIRRSALPPTPLILNGGQKSGSRGSCAFLDLENPTSRCFVLLSRRHHIARQAASAHSSHCSVQELQVSCQGTRGHQSTSAPFRPPFGRGAVDGPMGRLRSHPLTQASAVAALTLCDPGDCACLRRCTATPMTAYCGRPDETISG